MIIETNKLATARPKMKKEPVSTKTAPCILGGFADLRLSTALPGIIFEDNDLRIKKNDFPCCQGDGEIFDPSLNLTKRCQLIERLRTLQNLFNKFKTAHKISDEKVLIEYLSRPLSLEHLKLLASYQDLSQPQKGLVLKITEGQTSSSLSQVWLLAFAAAWRFGYQAKVLVFGKEEIPSLFYQVNHNSRNPAKGSPPIIVFVERVSELWKPPLAFSLEGIVGYCQTRCIPLWLDLVWSKKSGEAGEKTTKYSQRIENVKSRDPFSWLSAACKSRLREICY